MTTGMNIIERHAQEIMTLLDTKRVITVDDLPIVIGVMGRMEDVCFDLVPEIHKAKADESAMLMDVSSSLGMALWHLGNAYLAGQTNSDDERSLTHLLAEWGKRYDALPDDQKRMAQPPPPEGTGKSRRRIGQLIARAGVKVSTLRGLSKNHFYELNYFSEAQGDEEKVDLLYWCLDNPKSVLPRSPKQLKSKIGELNRARREERREKVTCSIEPVSEGSEPVVEEPSVNGSGPDYEPEVIDKSFPLQHDWARAKRALDGGMEHLRQLLLCHDRSPGSFMALGRGVTDIYSTLATLGEAIDADRTENISSNETTEILYE